MDTSTRYRNPDITPMLQQASALGVSLSRNSWMLAQHVAEPMLRYFQVSWALTLKCLLRSLRHYLRAQSREHHTVDRLEERGLERRSAGRSSLKRRGRAIANQMNIRTDLMTAFLGNV